MKVRLTAGEDAFEDVCGDQTIGEQIEGQHPELAGRLGDLTFAAVQNLNKVRSRNAQIGMEKSGKKPTKTEELVVWSTTGEGATPMGARQLRPRWPGRVPVMCPHCRKDAVPADGREARRPRVR